MVFPIYPSLHLLFEILAYALGYRYYIFLRRKTQDPFTEEQRLYLFIAAALGALIFSKLIANLEFPSLFFNSKTPWIFYVSNKTILGGLVGGLLGVEITKKILHLSRSSGDLITYPLLLAICVGRVGCLFGGVQDHTVGLATSLPWAFDFGDGVLRHPSSLYEIIFLLALWIFLVFLEKNKKLKEGVRFKIFMIAYLLFRFWIEFIKPREPLMLHLSAIQITCLFTLFYYAVLGMFSFPIQKKASL